METYLSKEITLNNEVIFIPNQRKLLGEEKETQLSENEARLLCMLLTKTCDKKEVMQQIWESRGVIVTESSYYKLVKQLRSAFSSVGLDSSLIMTLPRIGIRYIGTQVENDDNTKKSNKPKTRSINIQSIIISPLSFLFYLTCIVLFVLT
ncbi:Uncharacterised protein [Serratia quinivorans]|uniref:winged helix-turn-helix domain-containing protein n=1 Tax=Serratia quinivorans TaxID=137545 RepID=UPI00217C181A|nr:hypothetical protein [Serratia quinivorans]CAI1905818.1 Uncharacterised protein [Serratia quinivorans]